MSEHIILQNKFFTADRLENGVIRITGLAGELCYLIEGSERALLIDGLSGVGSLRAFVRELTELPVTMAATHGHIDHVGAGWEYGELFIHPDDIALMYTPMHSSVERRLEFTGANPMGLEKRTEVKESDVPVAHGIKTYPVYDGDVFDLGGTRIEVIGVPGHTYGSLVFLDREKRVIYSGDACNMNTLLNLAGSTTIEEYLESLHHFKIFQKDFDVMYGGHGREAVPNSIIDDAIAMCNRILEEQDEAVPVDFGEGAFLASDRGADYMPKCGGQCNIMYRKDMLRKRSHPEIQGVPNYYR